MALGEVQVPSPVVPIWQVIRQHVLLCSIGGVDPAMLRMLVNSM